MLALFPWGGGRVVSCAQAARSSTALSGPRPMLGSPMQTKSPVRLQVQAAREHGSYARRCVALDKALGMRAPDRDRRHRTHCKAIAAAAAFDGATTTPAVRELAHLGRADLRVGLRPGHGGDDGGAIGGPGAEGAHQLARRIGVRAPAQDDIEQHRRRRPCPPAPPQAAHRAVAGSIIGCGRPRVKRSSPRSIMAWASRIAPSAATPGIGAFDTTVCPRPL